MARILLISNGHGEDLSGAILGKELLYFGHQIDALPLVGRGKAYLDLQISIIGKTKQFTTGGIGYTSIKGRLTELFEGQILYLFARFFKLLFVAHRYDLFVVVGDVVPVVAAWLARRPVATYLVAYSSHYEGKLKLPWPCGQCLASKRFLRIFSRDQLTAEDLQSQLQKPVTFLGNPFMDQVLAQYNCPSDDRSCIGLIPGSRRPELDSNLILLLKVIECLIDIDKANNDISFNLALVSVMDTESLKNIAHSVGWKLRNLDDINITQLVHKNCFINVHRDSFSNFLNRSNVLLAMAGTATEQAIGLAKPVIQLPGYGPQFTKTFAEAQRRLLGPTVFCVEGKVGDIKTLRDTASLTLKILQTIKQPNNLLQVQCEEEALRRLGGVGGGTKIAKSIIDMIKVPNNHD